MPLVTVDQLAKTFVTKEGPLFRRQSRAIVAVDGVSFSVDAGEILGLLGPNGAGKTTTIKMLCTLIEPSAGDARVNGYSIRKEAERVRENLGVMLTGERTLYWKLTGRENLEYFAALYHLAPRYARQRIAELLSLVQLEERANTLVENYSTGMRIRLSFAKALLHDPPVLLFDEPTMSLDPQSARLIREIIARLRRDGKAVLLTTHYMEEADALSDRVAIIDHGRIIALDPPTALKQRVKTSDVIEISARNLVNGVGEQLKTLDGVTEAVAAVTEAASQSGVVKVLARKSKDVLPEVMEILVRRGIDITHVRIAEPSLEDVFVELTGRALRD